MLVDLFEVTCQLAVHVSESVSHLIHLLFDGVSILLAVSFIVLTNLIVPIIESFVFAGSLQLLIRQIVLIFERIEDCSFFGREVL